MENKRDRWPVRADSFPWGPPESLGDVEAMQAKETAEFRRLK